MGDARWYTLAWKQHLIPSRNDPGQILSSYVKKSDFEQENAGESSGIVDDEVIENKDNNEPPMVQVPLQPLPIDLIGNTMKVGMKSRKNEKLALTWQVMEYNLELFVNMAMFQTDRERNHEIEMMNKSAEASSDLTL
ncbi:uncharacterized protein LOC131624503 [Vicia villosa]|uniref:uncharacterized protein LOC131624503 n=1 Tax=Vicia villosa TaxID=3911 RepID=UPI00273B32ED|nr:uncharacterized protein LOC131624503 [Vicia villosa]